MKIATVHNHDNTQVQRGILNGWSRNSQQIYRWVVILMASNQITQGELNTDIPYFVTVCISNCTKW